MPKVTPAMRLIDKLAREKSLSLSEFAAPGRGHLPGLDLTVHIGHFYKFKLLGSQNSNTLVAFKARCTGLPGDAEKSIRSLYYHGMGDLLCPPQHMSITLREVTGDTYIHQSLPDYLKQSGLL